MFRICRFIQIHGVQKFILCEKSLGVKFIARLCIANMRHIFVKFLDGTLLENNFEIARLIGRQAQGMRLTEERLQGRLLFDQSKPFRLGN